MGIFGNKSGKLNTRNVYTLRETLELAKDPRYEQYEFVPIDPDDIRVGYRPELKEVVRSRIDKIKKNKRNSEFDEYVVADGRYKGIDEKVSENRNRMPMYNNYQSAKRYQPRDYGAR